MPCRTRFSLIRPSRLQNYPLSSRIFREKYEIAARAVRTPKKRLKMA